jgi:hypothetical protein
MEKVTPRQQAVLDILDEQIDALEEKLKKVQPIIDELQRLKRTRATLLNERGTTGKISASTRLTMEEVIHTLRELGPSTPNAIAEKLGVDVTVVRSHLNRYRDQRYDRNGEGTWHLIGIEPDDEEE